MTDAALLDRVSQRLEQVEPTTDHSLLVRWRVLSLCQRLDGAPESARTIRSALEDFASQGICARTEAALLDVEKLAGTQGSGSTSVLPRVSPKKQRYILERLDKYEARPGTIEQALAAVPELNRRLRQLRPGVVVAAVKHRLQLIVGLAKSEMSEATRRRACAAILYLDELHDAIPDTLGQLGLLDDDYALRTVLDELDNGNHLHWSELVSSLWGDLPFLRGVRLRRDGVAIPVTWLDRLNSFVCYERAMEGAERPVALLQPSVACEPMHALITLVGFLILDGLTSSRNLANELVRGQVYQVDGKYYAEFDGLWPPPAIGLRLRLRGGVVVQRPLSLVDRMVPVDRRQLTAPRRFVVEVPKDQEPIQRFFGWSDAIGAAAIPRRIALVTSRKRINEVFGSVESNGVQLLGEGLVRYLGPRPSSEDVRGTLVCGVSSVEAVRRAMESHSKPFAAVVIDGYDRAERGRHDLPFVRALNPRMPVIVWSSEGYYPLHASPSLGDVELLAVPQDDLAEVLALDGVGDEEPTAVRGSLWEAATGPEPRFVASSLGNTERDLVALADRFLSEVHSNEGVPDYWRYALVGTGVTLRMMAAGTPIFWEDVRDWLAVRTASFEEQWATLTRRGASQCESVRTSFYELTGAVGSIGSGMNTRGQQLLEFAADLDSEKWRLCFDRAPLAEIAKRFLMREQVRAIDSVVLSALPVCQSVIVSGWFGAQLAARLRDHTPVATRIFATPDEVRKWRRGFDAVGRRSSGSLLAAIGYHQMDRGAVVKDEQPQEAMELTSEQAGVTSDCQEEASEPCVLLTLCDAEETKVLSQNARVLVEDGDRVEERAAMALCDGDRVILGRGASLWSPAEEFTHEVMLAVEAADPELTHRARAWRTALAELADLRGLSSTALCDELKANGIARGEQTVEGWVDLSRHAPIGPRDLEAELSLLWKLVGEYASVSLEDAIQACSRLRGLRTEAGRALLRAWQGRSIGCGVEDDLVHPLLDKIRQQVSAHEVEAIELGRAPASVIGWWLPHEVAKKFR